MTTEPQKLKNLNDGSKSLWKLPDGQHVVVSRIPLFDHWETMIFHSNETGKVDNFRDLYCTHNYETHEDSIKNYLEDLV